MMLKFAVLAKRPKESLYPISTVHLLQILWNISSNLTLISHRLDYYVLVDPYS